MLRACLHIAYGLSSFLCDEVIGCDFILGLPVEVIEVVFYYFPFCNSFSNIISVESLHLTQGKSTTARSNRKTNEVQMLYSAIQLF